MSLPYKMDKIPYAKELRRNMTPQEKKLWYQHLSGYPVRFQRQKVIRGFIVDFYCAKAHLVIEVDGQQHYTAQGEAYDLDRSAVLLQSYVQVIRFTNKDIAERFFDVCHKIDEVVQQRLDEFSRRREEHSLPSS